MSSNSCTRFVGFLHRKIGTYKINCVRNTWKVARVIPPAATLPGRIQRNPLEIKELQLYHIIQTPEDVKKAPLQVVLTTYVEGYGNRGDVVNFENRDEARRHILIGNAVYASPYNLNKMAKGAISGASDEEDQVRLTTTCMPMARALSQLVVQADMNMKESWTISTAHMKLFLRIAGINCEEESIILPPQPITGPNFDLEWVPFRFYIVMNNQLVVPMIGRLHHTTPEESGKILTVGGDPKEKPTDMELSQANIVKQESVHVNHMPFTHGDNVWSIMQTKAKALVKKT